jgi:hypothetical protein
MDSDNLTDVERCLTGCQPSPQGLDADAMLYAAGRASLRGVVRARLWWACAAGTMTAVALGLGVWLSVERGERQALQDQLREQRQILETPAPVPAPSPSEEGPPRADYLTVRDLLIDKGVDAWREPDPGRSDQPRDPASPPLAEFLRF